MVVATGDVGTVWGLDLRTGAQIWSFDTGAPAFTNPLIVDGLVIVGDGSGVLWAFTLDGTEVWHTKLDGAIRGGAASDGRMVYAVTDSGDAAAFTLDGFEMWRTRIEQVRGTGRGDEVTDPVTVYAAPTVTGDELVIAYTVEGGPAGPAVVGLDRYVGSVVWQGSDPGQLNDFANLRNSPARYGDALIIASSLSRGVQGVDATTGRAIWATRTSARCEKQWASPIVVGDLVLLPRPDGSVQGFDATSGESRWRFVPAEGRETAPTANCVAGGMQVHDGFQLHASVAVAPDGTIIVASTSNAIYAIAEGA
jgi:outer membrane protein assembly factor BamB